MRVMKMKKLSLTLSLLLTLATTTFTAQATLIGDSVNGELLTTFAGSFPATTAIVGSGVEFSRVFNTAAGPGNPSVELDVHGDSFTFTFANPLTTDCGSNTSCSFNLGLEGIELNDLDWVDNPAGEITGLTLLSSTFVDNAIAGFGFGSHNVWVDFNTPIIPGFDTVWSATWSIQTNDAINVSAPPILVLLAMGLGFMGLFRKLK
jgi:hypothetical protein